MTPTPSSTIAAILTPLGQGGIAILHVAGPRAFELLAQLFRPRSAGAVVPDAARLHYGHIVDGVDVVDEVLVRLVPAEKGTFYFSAGEKLNVPFSAREPTVEVNCHGGLVAVQRVMECFTRRGAEEVGSEEFVARQAVSPIQAEAIVALQHAATPFGVEVLLDQLGGALERALQALPWDHPAEAADALCGLLATARLGKALWQPPRVALVGPVNAGKSSLFNALAREDRMIVSPTPGTTRDAVSALVALDGLPVLLTDTAGEREPGSAIEREAIAHARAAAAEAALTILVLDCSCPNPQSGIGNPQWLTVLNKCDLGLAPWAQATAEAIAVSALRGDGLEELSLRIVAGLVGEARYQPGRPVVFTERQEKLLSEALAAVEAGDWERARRGVEEAYCPA